MTTAIISIAASESEAARGPNPSDLLPVPVILYVI